MAKNKITQRMDTRFSQDFADVQQYLRESNGNQSQTYVFVDVTISGSGVNGTLIFGTDLKGNPSATSVTMKVRPANLGGGIDFYNNSNVKIASLDSSGNFKARGNITGNTTP